MRLSRIWRIKQIKEAEAEVDNTLRDLLNSSYPTKNPCLNQATQKNSEIKNFKPKKILRSSLSLEIRSSSPWEARCIIGNVKIVNVSGT